LTTSIYPYISVATSSLLPLAKTLKSSSFPQIWQEMAFSSKHSLNSNSFPQIWQEMAFSSKHSLNSNSFPQISHSHEVLGSSFFIFSIKKIQNRSM